MAVWLLDFTAGGVVYRFATSATVVALADGSTIQYSGGLNELTLGSASQSGERSESVVVASSVDWFAVKARGATLRNQQATVRFYVEGDVLETARVYLRGRTTAPKHGAIGEPLTLTIRENASDQAFNFPLAQAVVEDETWPVTAANIIVDKNQGKPYPLVIGIPGHHPKAGTTYRPEMASPAIYAEYKATATTAGQMVIADGHIAATSVPLYDALNFGTSLDKPVTLTTDALGRRVSVIQNAPLSASDVDLEWWVGFGNAGVYGGGRLNPYGGGYLRGAGDVIRWVLEECTTLDVDTAAVIGAAAWLNRWKVDAVVNQSINMLDWLDSEVLAHIPVIRVNGPRGIYYAPMRWDAVDSDVVAHLRPGMVSRASDETQYDDEIRNSMSIQYRPQRDGTAFGSRRVLGPEYGRHESGWGVLGMTSLPWNTTTFEDVRFFADPLCRWSYAYNGPREWSGTNSSCWDDASIALSLDYMALRYATQKRMVRYGGPMGQLEGLEPGAVVRLTDPEMYVDAVLALVVERLTSTTQVYLDLVILDDPFKTSRKTD